MGRTILIADTDDATREGAAWFLRAGGYRALTAATGMDVIAALADESIDLLLLDVELRDVDAAAVLRHLEKDEHLRCIPVLALGIVRAGPLVALAALDRPFTTDKLSRAVRGLIGPPPDRLTPPTGQAAVALRAELGRRRFQSADPSEDVD
jgi:CheY-like chemotaxis protein